ncbi:MAG: 3-hydroxyacyl-ACP dehydratase FabZ [Cytophagales bacterium]|nr:3-hydroxyacyl-ACP dehydratase FabZ [Armatimonadota bacterium]
MELEAKDILKILPHRYPFLLVDRILEVEPGKRIVGIKNVTMNEEFFVGHFPGEPIMPGVLILEMMAQAGGVMLLTIEENQGKLAYLAGVEKARFRKPVLPGDTLTAEITMLRARANMGWVKATARVDGKVACEAELAFALVEREAIGGHASAAAPGE